jgi:hypothetical protein
VVPLPEVPLEFPPVELDAEAVLLPLERPEVVEFNALPAVAENGLAAPEPHPTIEVMAMRPALSLSTT